MATTKPADHVQPKDQPQHITVDGLELIIHPNVFDDYEMMEFIYDLQNVDDDSDNAFSIIPFLKKLCGNKYAAVKNLLREPDGRIPVEKVSEFITKLMQELNPNF